MRVNLGCGLDRKPGWVNVDNAADADVCEDAVGYLARLAPGTVDEIYAGHFLEHLEYGLDDWEGSEAHRMLVLCHRALRVGGVLGVVVPDTKEVVRRYFFEGDDLDAVCGLFFYSTVQPSRHRWSWDLVTLRRALERAGLRVVDEIDRFEDPRLAAGAWFQIGLEAVKE